MESGLWFLTPNGEACGPTPDKRLYREWKLWFIGASPDLVSATTDKPDHSRDRRMGSSNARMFRFWACSRCNFH
jgi:hypothetical protein